MFRQRAPYSQPATVRAAAACGCFFLVRTRRTLTLVGGGAQICLKLKKIDCGARCADDHSQHPHSTQLLADPPGGDSLYFMRGMLPVRSGPCFISTSHPGCAIVTAHPCPTQALPARSPFEQDNIFFKNNINMYKSGALFS